MKGPGAILVFVLAGCSTLAYQPPPGTEGIALPLAVGTSPRSLALGDYRLAEVAFRVTHGDLPFEEDGGTYSLVTEAEYSFQGPSGALGQVVLVRDADVAVAPGGQPQTAVAVTRVRFTTISFHADVPVNRSMASDSFLQWDGAGKTTVTLDSRSAPSWGQPTGLKLVREGFPPAYVSLVVPFAVYGLPDAGSLNAEAALALLVSFEAATRNLDPGPLDLPSRQY